MDEEGHLVHVEFETIQGSSDEDEDAKVWIACNTWKDNIDSFVWHRIKEIKKGIQGLISRIWFSTVLWIRGIFGMDPDPRIRATNVPYGSRSCSFRQWQDAPKNKFFVLSFLLITGTFWW